MNDLLYNNSTVFTITIEEVLRRTTIVSATSHLQAIDKVKKRYEDEEIILDDSDFKEVNFY